MADRHSKMGTLFKVIVLLIVPSLSLSQIRSDFMIDPDTTFNQSMPAVALDKNGHWHIIYSAHHIRAEYIKHILLNKDGEFLKPPHIVNDTLASMGAIIGLNIAAAQNYAVVGMRTLDPSGKNIFFQILNKVGDPLMRAYRFPDATDVVGNIDLCFITDSIFCACYKDRKPEFEHEVICMHLGSILGYLLTKYKIANNDSASFYQCEWTTVASNLSSNTIVVVWQDNNSGIFQIFCKIFSKDLTPISSRILITDDMKENDSFYPEAKMASDGSFLLMWISKVDDHYNVYFRKFTNNGNPITRNIKVNWDPLPELTTADIAIDDEGKFIVVWVGTGITNQVIFGQRFSKDGLPIGENFIITAESNKYSKTSPHTLLLNNKIYNVWKTEPPTGIKGKSFIQANILDFNNPSVVLNRNNNKTHKHFRFYQNYPNPFNSQTNFCYELPEKKHVTIHIYDISGREIITLLDEAQCAGSHQVLWNGQDKHQHDLPSGIYVVTLKADDMIQAKKIALVR